MFSNEGSEEDTHLYHITQFKECVLKGRWKDVIAAYRNYSYCHKITINESRGTALHMAVNDGRVELVNTLFGEILRHEGSEEVSYESALTSTNERGDTPLHLAASRGFIGMCKCIIGKKGERKDLIRVRNNKGETPIFKAVLNGQTKAFVYLHHVSIDLDVPLRNYAGDTILHNSIWREFLDLAIIISHCYPGLVNTRNKDGATPLKVLACKPSAFKSGSNLPWWKQILYYVVSEDSSEQNEEENTIESAPKNEEENTIESAPKNEEKEIIFVAVATKADTVDLLNELQNKLPMLNQQMNSAAKEDEKVSAFFTAARNGIEEIVLGLQFKVPSVIHETSPRNENVLLVAVKNKQVRVTELLRRYLSKEIFYSLILEMDDRENTVLHLAAASTPINERIWQRAGNTMQMIRDIKWYEYISGLVPEQFNYLRNKDGETAWEIYERKHMQKVKDSSDALKDLSNSASVVAALIAGVSSYVFSMAALFGLGFSITALVMFLAILTSSKQAQDFRFSLPLKLIFGLSSLFASVASMLVSFWAAYFFVLNEKYKIIIFPVCAATCLPLTIYAVMQFPFYVELVRVISSKTPLPYRTHHPFIGPTFSR
ncbi:hypothetical protein ACSQ67_011615 [Phaseolus vulgaris]